MRRFPATLVQRLVLTLTAAFVLVWIALFAHGAWQALAKNDGEVDRGLSRAAASFGAAFDFCDEPQCVRVVARSVTRLLQIANDDGPRRDELSLVVLDAAGALIYASAQAPVVPAEVASGTTSPVRFASRGRPYVGYRGGERWKVLVLDEANLRREDLMLQLAKSLTVSIALAFPLVLLPVWLAVRAGLHPLRRLSQEVQRRDAADLSPFTLKAPYQELAPLVAGLNDLLERVKRALRKEEAFVHDAAHELRTPLAVIATQAHLLQTAADDTTRAQAAARLEAAVERASHVAEQLLQLAQMDARDASRRDMVDLAQVARDSVAFLAPRAARRDIEVSFDGPDSLLRQSDPLALRSIVDNLLGNAIKYGRQGGEVQVRLHSDGRADVLTVIDDGPGIAAALRPHLFQRFRRGEAAAGAGAGLGLAIVKRAVESLGGSISVEPGLHGRGTSFVASLPAT